MEIELKFEVDAAAARALNQTLALATEGEAQTLHSVYFDTPDARLFAGGVTLRVRDDGRRFVQTLKTLGEGVRRGEWEAEVPGPGLDLDTVADTPFGEALGRCELHRLRPAFETRVERCKRDICVGEAVVEVALDRGVVDAGGAGAPLLELELELKSGGPEALFVLARELAEVAPLNLTFTSKAARGFALVDGEPLAPMRARDPSIGRRDDAARAFRTIAGGALAQIAENARVLRHARRIEALHQLRVGARRLRSALSLFRPMLEDERLGTVKAEIRWLTHELDDARNLDVFIADTFRPAARRHANWIGLAALGRALITAQTHAYDRAEAAIGSARYRALMLETTAWIETGDWSRDADPAQAARRARPAAALAREILRDRRRKIVRTGRGLAELDPPARHKLRIAAKKLRYACGFFGSLYAGKSAKRLQAFVRAIEALQDALGALTDIASAGSVTAKLAGAEVKGAATGDVAFAAGLVAGERQVDVAKTMRAASKAFRRFDQTERFW